MLYKVKNKNIRNVFLHATVWFLYAFIIWGINLLAETELNSYLRTVLFLVPYFAIFYINIYCLNLYEKKGLLFVILSFITSIIVIGAIGYIYIYEILPMNGIKIFRSKDIIIFIQSALLNYFHFFSLSILYYYIQKTIRTAKRLREIQKEKIFIEQLKFKKELENESLKRRESDTQKEKLQYEYALLKAQINPHFLHNTLNVLFSQAMDYSEDLASNILKLSQIMRFSIESVESDCGKINIEKELEYLQTLLEIHRLRFDVSKFIKYTLTGKPEGQLLPPLAIITIVENAFKYGDLKDKNYPLQININLLSNEIHLQCINKKKGKNTEISSSNIGLKNLNKRLEIYFKNRYVLEIAEDSLLFTVNMQIKN